MTHRGSSTGTFSKSCRKLDSEEIPDCLEVSRVVESVATQEEQLDQVFRNITTWTFTTLMGTCGSVHRYSSVWLYPNAFGKLLSSQGYPRAADPVQVRPDLHPQDRLRPRIRLCHGKRQINTSKTNCVITSFLHTVLMKFNLIWNCRGQKNTVNVSRLAN